LKQKSDVEMESTKLGRLVTKTFFFTSYTNDLN
jgi:hypothetical protein